MALNAGCTFYTGPPSGGGSGVVAAGGGGNIDPGAAELGAGAEPKGKWTNVTSNLARLKSACGNLSLVAAHPSQDQLIAMVANRGLWSSVDGGTSWQALGLGALSAPVRNLATAIVFDPEAPEKFWESGVNGDIGVLMTIDSGKHFLRRGATTYNESISVDFTDPERKTVLLGGREQKQKVYLSSDSGVTFTEIGADFPADADISTFPLVLDANTFLMGSPAFSTGVSGIYRSEDRGTSWELVSETGGQGAPLVTSAGEIYWASAKGGPLVKSADGGLEFQSVVGPNLVQGFSPIELPGGRIAAVSARHIVVSSDGGKKWSFATAALPFTINGFTYSNAQQAFFVWHLTCDGESPVPTDAIMRYDFE